jgi:1,2-dihydroxy-3-keto-5-methylthiopentene dioxygenase
VLRYADAMRAHYRSNHAAVDAHTLERHGVHFQHLGLDPATYQPVLDALKSRSGYVTQDEVQLSKATPNLDVVMKKFDDEHTHADDEIRFVLAGEGVFDIRDHEDRMIRVVVEAGDLIVVPAGVNHRFELTAQCHIHCVRLFKDEAGWVPQYRHDPPPA